MDNRKDSICSHGYWTGEVEFAAAARVDKIPAVLNSSMMVEGSELPIKEGEISYQVYLQANQAFRHLIGEGEQAYPMDRVHIQKVSELILNSKDGGATASCDLYHVACDDRKDMHFFILADSAQVLAYVRVHEKNKYPLLKDVYGEQAIVTIEAIETCVESKFAYGSLLVQIAFEYSLNHGYGGRVGLYSVASSGSKPPAGQFFYKTGFTPLDPDMGVDLSGGYNLAAENMFYTDAAIAAWSARVNQHPVLHHQTLSTLKIKDDKHDSVLRSASVFAKQAGDAKTSEVRASSNQSSFKK